jgi:Putative beta-barrel porin 2
MISPKRSALAALGVLISTTAAFAQIGGAQPRPGDPSSEEPPPARIHFGPVGVRPALILREIGYDSNVLNQNTDEQGDVTATVGARVDLGARVARFLANGSTFYEYLYFKDFASERGSNRGAEGRVDLLLGRLRPHVLGGVRTSHDRPSPEIDTRALRTQTTLGTGLAVAAGGLTTLTVAYRREAGDFGDDEVFRDVNLAEELNLRSHSLTFGAAFELTPLTTVSVNGEERRDRFTESPDRDANSHRLGVTASFNPLALISGQATVGFAAFRPLSDLEPDYTGLTAAISLAYAFHDQLRIALTIDRDVRYSFIEETPYYVGTGGRVTFTQHLFRNIDGQVTIGFDRIAYEARLDGPEILDDLTDRVRLAGGGIGVRLSEDARLAINYDHTERFSAVPTRQYSRGRLYATLNYGF